jgi:putative hemolysin
MPGKMNLCLLPDGEMHLETECSTPCSLAAAQTVTTEGYANSFYQLNADRGGCLDFTVEENATRQQIHNASQSSAPGLLILPKSVGLFPAGQLLTFAKVPAPSPHLKSHQTTVLRI